MKTTGIITIIALLVILSGCTSTTVSRSVSLSMRADPSPMFASSSTTLHVDVDNRGVKTINNVVVDVFDTGILYGDSCGANYARMLPGEFKTFSCLLNAPDIDEPADTLVSSLMTYSAAFSSVTTFGVMNENEYQRRLSTGGYSPGQEKFSYSDSNVAVDVEFSDPVPFVLTEGKKHFVYFTITNIGDGFIHQISEGDFRILSEDILLCQPFGTLSPNGRTFPRIACEIEVAEGHMEGRDFRNFDIRTDFMYNYELRNSIKIDVVR